MILSPDQTERFYRIWFALLKYANDEKHIVRSFPEKPKVGSVKKEDAIKIRNKLWNEDGLIDRFIAKNPAALSLPDLEIVSTWKHHVAGNFFILQHLKKHSIFLSESSPARAYGVLGLLSPFEEVVGPYLPVYVRATLLPFEDKIIYDGLLESYNIAFGSGIRADMKIWLRDAEECEGIITSLISNTIITAQDSKVEIKARNIDTVARIPKATRFRSLSRILQVNFLTTPLLSVAVLQSRNISIIRDFQKALYKSGLSPKMVEQHSGNIQSFADYLLAQNPPLRLLEIQIENVDSYLNSLNVKNAKSCVTSFKRYERFLWDTARSDPETLGNLNAFLKSYRQKK